MENGNGKRVVVAMSGGVDSSVTAGLLVEAGYEVIGMTMQLYDRKDMATPVKGSCCSLDDVFDARRVAEQLGIPFYVLNFQEAFKKIVVENLTGEYLSGRTPNPCIRCNDFMKFRLLLKRAMSLGAEFMATGHYAQIIEDEGTWRLRKAVDPDKDQTYFLYGMNQDQMSKVRFPLGGMTKAEVREHARRLGISTAEKSESQDVCFIAGEKYTDFIERTVEELPGTGKIVDTDGKVLGTHQGSYRYTVGQRKGLALPGPEKRYVVEVKPDENTVVVGGESDLQTTELETDTLHWVGKPAEPTEVLLAKIRYRSEPTPARIEARENGGAQVTFLEPVKAVTPGQTLVLYREDEVVGGGLIAAKKRRSLPMAS